MEIIEASSCDNGLAVVKHLESSIWSEPGREMAKVPSCAHKVDDGMEQQMTMYMSFSFKAMWLYFKKKKEKRKKSKRPLCSGWVCCLESLSGSKGIHRT